MTDHFCPGCGTARKAFPRYPWHFCNDCRDTACDKDGRKLSFGNEGPGGGFAWSFDDEDVFYTGGSVVCLINGRPVLVGEARFGGVVAQPLTSSAIGYKPYALVDVRNGKKSETPLKPKPKRRP